MKFTIVMTVYEREELFLHALYTVIQQDYSNWELIVIADGPHPNIERAVELVKQDKYQAFWDRDNIRDRIVYHEVPKSPDGTVGNPLRRFGLEIATGDYICFVGHDCLIDKNYLSTHKGLIDKKKETCVSVVSVLYWTIWPNKAVAYADVPVLKPAIPEFVGRIPWSFTGKIDMATATSGEVDLTCFCFPVIEARQVGVFSLDLDDRYDADFQSFSKLRAILPVVFTSKPVAGHF
jgi:glycosyltransferase involved in cell wall biosynthesis